MSKTVFNIEVRATRETVQPAEKQAVQLVLITDSMLDTAALQRVLEAIYVGDKITETKFALLDYTQRTWPTPN